MKNPEMDVRIGIKIILIHFMLRKPGYQFQLREPWLVSKKILSFFLSFLHNYFTRTPKKLFGQQASIRTKKRKMLLLFPGLKFTPQ